MKTVTPKTILQVTLGTIALQVGTPSIADQVILDDLIVDGSICVGLDCVDGESFGFDTLRLKENNLRIKAQDTSSSASFPSNDWQITFNESSNGGANKFSIDDIDGGRTPFTIEAGAPSHSLYVDDGGRIGFGTSTPVVEIHAQDGDTPTLRLEQDGSSGFTAQTWDVAGNETNFFIRDVSNGSTLPFRVRPGAPTSALDIAGGSGNVGIGTPTPGDALHIRRSGEHKIVMENTAGNLDSWAIVNASSGLRFSLQGSGAIEFEVLRDSNSGSTKFQLANTGGDRWANVAASTGYRISRQQSGSIEFEIHRNGDATLDGTLTQNSDANSKTKIENVSLADVLSKVMELPISEWSYIDDPSTRHVGPMAQDFHAAFGLGKDEKGISTLDASGIALSAVQGVKLEKDREILELQRQNSVLRNELAELRALVKKLQTSVQGQ